MPRPMYVCCAGQNGTNIMQVNISCAKTYQWEWWGLWFEICLLIALFVTAFFEAFHKGRLIFISYFLLATMTLSLGAHNFINSSFVGLPQFNVSDRQQARTPQSSAHIPPVLAQPALLRIRLSSKFPKLVCSNLGFPSSQRIELATKTKPRHYCRRPNGSLRSWRVSLPNPSFEQPNVSQAAYNAGAAGYVLLCIFNFALLIILGASRATHALLPQLLHSACC